MPEARRSFLDEACGGDTELRRQVEMLVSLDENAGSLLEKPALADFTLTPAAGGSLSPGTRLGPYEILSLLGAGGMGEVWKARDTRLNRLVAIKTSHARFTERFEREARFIAALNHPHICSIYDVATSPDGFSFLVMEYVEGKPLHGPVPIEEALRLAGQILDAIDAAHSKEITHRDLKPSNILVGNNGGKVLDFGLAKIESEAGTQTALTGEGAILGTLTIAGSDSGGGAGIQADLKTFAAHGVYGLSAVTAVTAQNSLGVRAVAPVPPAVVAAQIDAVLEDFGADAVKIGMLWSADTVRVVAARLRAHLPAAGAASAAGGFDAAGAAGDFGAAGAANAGGRRQGRVPIVLDPVMAAGSGAPLLAAATAEAVAALIEELLPMATLVTPNLPELVVLAEGLRLAAPALASPWAEDEGAASAWGARRGVGAARRDPAGPGRLAGRRGGTAAAGAAACGARSGGARQGRA